MKRLLCEVELAFDISGRGCVVVPGIPYSFPVAVGIGAKLLIETASGEIIETTVAGLEMINRGKPMDYIPFSIKGVSKDRVPTGSKVYLAESTDTQPQLQADAAAPRGLI